MTHSVRPAEAPAVQVTGASSDTDQQYAAEKIRSLATHTHRPLCSAQVVIEHAGNPAASWRVKASGNVNLGGVHLHASGTGSNYREAVDRLHARLHVELSRGRRTQ